MAKRWMCGVVVLMLGLVGCGEGHLTSGESSGDAVDSIVKTGDGSQAEAGDDAIEFDQSADDDLIGHEMAHPPQQSEGPSGDGSGGENDPIEEQAEDAADQLPDDGAQDPSAEDAPSDDAGDEQFDDFDEPNQDEPAPDGRGDPEADGDWADGGGDPEADGDEGADDWGDEGEDWGDEGADEDWGDEGADEDWGDEGADEDWGDEEEDDDWDDEDDW